MSTHQVKTVPLATQSSFPFPGSIRRIKNSPYRSMSTTNGRSLWWEPKDWSNAVLYDKFLISVTLPWWCGHHQLLLFFQCLFLLRLLLLPPLHPRWSVWSCVVLCSSLDPGLYQPNCVLWKRTDSVEGHSNVWEKKWNSSWNLCWALNNGARGDSERQRRAF